MRHARLLELEPTLARALSAEERQSASRALPPVSVLEIQRGRWQPPESSPRKAELGMLVVEGLLTRELVVDRARSVELLGAGDVIRPWQEDASSFCASTWQALEPTQVAILDDRVVAAMAAYPRLVVALVERSLRRSRFMALEAAISNLIGIEKRVLLLLWQVAEKCGRVEQRGVVVGPGLTHELIAEMIGARRQTVTQAITALVAAGAIERRADGAWMLLEQPQPPAVAEARRLHGATSEPSGSTGDAA